MGVLTEHDRKRGKANSTSLYRHLKLLSLLALLILVGSSQQASALQRHTLVPTETQSNHTGAASSSAPVLVPVQQQGGGAAGQHAEPQQPAPPGTQSGAGAPHGQSPPQGHSAPTPSSPAHPPGASPEMEQQGHGAPGEPAEEAHGEHAPPLPVISPIPGVTFVQTMIDLLNHELKGRFFGWRPNDIIIGRFTDNINYYQLGVLEALRFTTLRLKDSLTRMGDADAYDPDLEQALNLLMNSATLFWFPSAESSYSKAIDHLSRFQEKLKSGQRNFYYRVDNLLNLLTTYKDLMGNVNRSLVRPTGWFDTDDYFYYAKGVAHVYYEILRVVRVGYQSQLAATLNALDIMDAIIHELYIAEKIDPWLILDSSYSSLLANHRANLNAPLSEVAHMLGVMARF